jgi:hypothetical protein
LDVVFDAVVIPTEVVYVYRRKPDVLRTHAGKLHMLRQELSASTTRIEWSVDSWGYEVVRSRALIIDPEVPPESLMLMPLGGPPRRYDIGLGEPNARVYIDLLNMKETEAGAIEFAKKWGLLSVRAGRSGAPAEELYGAKRKLHGVWKIAQKQGPRRLKALLGFLEGQKLDDCSVRVGVKPGGEGPEVLWYVKHLHGFCWHEMIRELGGAAELMQCLECGDFFSRKGKGPAPETCSDRCTKRRQRRSANT